MFQLLEINSHSLFSKWFSESGKLVLKMFQSVQTLLDQPDAFVIVLIGARACRRVPARAYGCSRRFPWIGRGLPRRGGKPHGGAPGVHDGRRAVRRRAGPWRTGGRTPWTGPRRLAHVALGHGHGVRS